MGDTMYIGGNTPSENNSFFNRSQGMNRFAEFREKYSNGNYKIKFISDKGHFSLQLYKSCKVPLLGKFAYGKPVMTVDVSLTQLGFAESLYLSCFGRDQSFGRENKINYAEYKAYVMHGFNENATSTPMDLMHAVIGMSGELGEVHEIIKKHVFHGKPLDRIKLIEELGDAQWYTTAFLSLMDISLADVLMANKAKLDSRYENGRRDLMFRDPTIEYELMSNKLGGKFNGHGKKEAKN